MIKKDWLLTRSTIPLIEILKYGFGPVNLSGISTSGQLGP